MPRHEVCKTPTPLSFVQLDVGIESYQTLQGVHHQRLRGVENVLVCGR